jgi:hypothetical protein
MVRRWVQLDSLFSIPYLVPWQRRKALHLHHVDFCSRLKVMNKRNVPHIGFSSCFSAGTTDHDGPLPLLRLLSVSPTNLSVTFVSNSHCLRIFFSWIQPSDSRSALFSTVCRQSAHMAVRLSALRTGPSSTRQKHYFSASGTHFCCRLSKP